MLQLPFNLVCSDFLFLKSILEFYILLGTFLGFWICEQSRAKWTGRNKPVWLFLSWSYSFSVGCDFPMVGPSCPVSLLASASVVPISHLSITVTNVQDDQLMGRKGLFGLTLVAVHICLILLP